MNVETHQTKSISCAILVAANQTKAAAVCTSKSINATLNASIVVEGEKWTVYVMSDFLILGRAMNTIYFLKSFVWLTRWRDVEWVISRGNTKSLKDMNSLSDAPWLLSTKKRFYLKKEHFAAKFLFISFIYWSVIYIYIYSKMELHYWWEHSNAVITILLPVA